MKFSILLLFLSLVCFSFSAQARLLQIIHTNDLHSYFMGYRDGKGGYAKVKTKIMQLRQEAQRKGIEVLQIDGGDWGEGTSFFLSDKGAASIKAIEMLGVEVAVIGNHDHMMGGPILGDQIRRANVRTKFISANLVQTNSMGLRNLVTPYVDVNRAGISIRIIGLSTADAHYQYQLKPGFILPPVQVGDTQSKEARKAGKELVMALTHLGKGTDVDLAKGSSEIDLIVGGHSHDRIEKVLWVKNKQRKDIPIVQAGSHGLVVGSLLIDVRGSGDFSVVDYKLHEILPAQAQEPVMVNFVAQAAQNRNQYFNGRWEQIIGNTLIPLAGYVNGRAMNKVTCWGKHMARMSAEVTKANIGVHLAAFEGVYLDAGPIRYGDMVDNFPHIRKYGDMGWEISTIQVSGRTLTVLIGAFVTLQSKFGINFYGLDYVNMKVHGAPIKKDAYYTVAFPTEVAYALKATIPPLARRLFPGLRNSGQFYWPSMENYISRNSPLNCF